MNIKCEEEEDFSVAYLSTYQWNYLEHMANGIKEIYPIKKNAIHLLKQLNIKDYRSKHGT